MSAKIDKLFRTKLTDHATAPSANAWARVEAGLPKKNNGLVWFRWAAVLLIPVIVAGVLVFRRADVDQKLTADNRTSSKSEIKKKPEQKPEDSKNKSGTSKPDKKDASKKAPATTPLKSNPSGQVKKSQAPPQALPNEAGTNVAIRNENENRVTEEIVTVQETAIETPQTAAIPVAKEKPIVIEYTLGSVEPEVPVEKGITLTMELKEKNGFQKVIDFARDAKNSEGPLTTLRQAKQELFAFNFKKDKHPK